MLLSYRYCLSRQIRSTKKVSHFYYAQEFCKGIETKKNVTTSCRCPPINTIIDTCFCLLANLRRQTYTHSRVLPRIHTRKHAHVHTHSPTQTLTYMHTCAHIPTRTHTCVHIYIHAQVHTQGDGVA